MTQRSYGWCFTCNNYTEEEYGALLNMECQYVVIGKEIGESGTPTFKVLFSLPNLAKVWLLCENQFKMSLGNDQRFY